MDFVIARLIQYENENFDASPQWTDRATGAPVDFTGSTFAMHIKAAGGEEGPALATASIGTGQIAQGIVRIQVGVGTLPAGEYRYDLVRTSSGARNILMTGIYDVRQGVSQP